MTFLLPVTKHPVIHQDAMVRVLKRSDMTYTPASIGISSNRIKAIVSIAWVVRKASEMSYHIDCYKMSYHIDCFRIQRF